MSFTEWWKRGLALVGRGGGIGSGGRARDKQNFRSLRIYAMERESSNIQILPVLRATRGNQRPNRTLYSIYPYIPRLNTCFYELRKLRVPVPDAAASGQLRTYALVSQFSKTAREKAEISARPPDF